MDVRLLVVKCLSLLYWESVMSDGSDSRNLVNDVLKELAIKSDGDNGLNILYNLQGLIRDIINGNQKPMLHDILQKVKLICGTDQILYDSIVDNISLDLSLPDISNSVLSHRFELNKYLNTTRTVKKLEQLLFDVKFKKDEIGDVNRYLSTKINNMNEDLEVHEDDIPGIEMEIDMRNVAEVRSQFEEIKSENNGKRILKTPWQAMNRMTRGGIRLGEFVTIAAPPHCNKSGMTLNILTGVGYFTNPADLMKDHNKIPTLVLFSLEDKIRLAIRNMYVILKGNLENKQVTDEELENLDIDVAAQWVVDQVGRNGYVLKIVKFNPDNINYRDLQNKIIALENRGHEIHLCAIDYLSLVNKEGLDNTRLDIALQDLFRKTKNFFAGHDIAVITPHQLNTVAIEMRNETKYMVKEVCGGGYYMESRGLSREPDLELYIDKVVEDGVSYQPVARGKHRGFGDTKPEDLFFILRFRPDGGIKWDINGKDTSIKRFGMTRDENGNEQSAFFVGGEAY